MLRLVCISLNQSTLGWCKTQDAAMLRLQNSVETEFVLVEHLHVERRALVLKWIYPCKRQDKSCYLVYASIAKN